MNNSWLVQRLDRPRTIMGKDNPFSFGGGFKNGGLTDDAMDLIRGIWSFDYMGAAEYEFGDVPKALSAIAVAADEGDLVAFTIHTKSGDVHVLCHKDHGAGVDERIRCWAERSSYGKPCKHEYESGYSDKPLIGAHTLRDPTYLHETLTEDPVPEWRRTIGGLELENGFLFFTDREAWEKAAALFGVEVEVDA